MDKLLIRGGQRLSGTVEIRGAKNAALPAFAASLLSDKPLTLRNLPDVVDVKTMQALLEGYGVTFSGRGADALTLDAAQASPRETSYDTVRKMRATILVLLDALERLCLALGIDLSQLFKRMDRKKGTAQLVKRREQMEVVRVGTKYGYTYKLLSYDKGPKKLFDPFFVEMDKKSQSYPRFAHPGTEFIYVLQGRVEYRFGDLTYLLEPGDAFTFSGDVVHGPERLLDDQAKFLSIIMYSE